MNRLEQGGCFRLLAFDLDGTLLERDGTLAAESARFLQSLAGRGVELVAATGRRLWSALPHLHRAGLAGTCVVHNGAMVADVASARSLDVHHLGGAAVRGVIGALGERGYSPLLFTSAPRGPREVLVQAEASDPTGYCDWYFRYAAGHITSCRELAAEPLDDVLRVVTHGERDALLPLVAAVEKALGGEVRGFLQRENTVPAWRAEFLARSASKWSGVTFIAQQRGLLPAQVVTVGDEQNDVEMLRAAGHSLAAPGASESARAAAREQLAGDGPRAVVAALARVFAER